MAQLARVPRLGWLAAAGGLAVVALAVLGVDWDAPIGPGDYVVGVGTLALAVATVWLGRHAARQAEFTKESIETSERPFVIATPHKDHPGGIRLDMGSNQFSYRLWNLGRGPAIVVRVRLQEDDGGRDLIRFLRPCPVAVGGGADLVADIEQFSVPLHRKFTLRIAYLDGSGRPYETTQEVWRDNDGDTLSSVWIASKRLRARDLKQSLVDAAE